MSLFHGFAAICFYVTFSCSQASDDFLGKPDYVGGLMEDLEATIGRDVMAGFGTLKALIQPMFLALPKRSGELVSPATARYALHRINLDEHGWSINGMEPTKEAFNTTHYAVTDILKDLLPEHILALFKRHITSSDGISLDEVTMMASTVEHFVHEDQRGILRNMCEIFDLPTVGSLRPDSMRNLVKAYLARFLDFVPLWKVERFKDFNRLFEDTHSVYPMWDGASMLVDDEIDTLAYVEKDQANPFRTRETSMDVALRVVKGVADHFPTILNANCLAVKEDLLDFDKANTGRIRLSDFYRAGMMPTAKSFYVETEDYLRAIGALDDTDSTWGPKMMIPNYIQGESNCDASGKIYSICCRDECEGLYGSLEQAIAAPEASSELIISLVSALSSSTVQAPRNISTALVSRLHEVATMHGGKVILHSRLFAQWMHQAFPRECRYPHLAGTTTDLPRHEWVRQTGLHFRVEPTRELKARFREVLSEHIEQLDGRFNVDSDAIGVNGVESDLELLWSSDDEHLVEPQVSLFKSMWYWALPVASIILFVFAMLLKSGKHMAFTDDGKKWQSVNYDARSFTV